MRRVLSKLIKKTIVFEYDLPNTKIPIPSALISTNNDKCYSAKNTDSLKKIIYNSIIEYSFNEYDLNNADYKKLLTRALKTKIRYDESASEDTKVKYGFFGEVILYAILKTILGARPIISRGYFYNPLENSETKGYDSYHLIEKKGCVELWFGEVKFHVNYKSGIDDMFGKKEKGKKFGWKLKNALSDEYLNKNVIAIVDNHKNNLNIKNSQISKIIKAWEETPEISLIEELKKNNIKLVYPILILYEQKKDFDNSIDVAIKHINSSMKKINLKLSINYSLFFILIPIEEVAKIKKDVIL